MTEAPAGRIGPPPPHVIETEVGDDISLYDARREYVLVLNRTASDIWLLCDGDLTQEEITSRLASAYQTTPEDIRADVEMTLQEFVAEGFLNQW